MIEQSQKFFGNFEIERICLDKYFFVVYDELYSKEEHNFDKEIAQTYAQYLKRSRSEGKGQYIDVLRRETKNSSYELHLSGSRHIFVHVNLIRIFQEKYNIFPDKATVIHTDNFLPKSSTVTFLEFLELKNEIEKDFQTLYKSLIKDLWHIDLKSIKIKPVQLELAYEVSPASVNDISQNFWFAGISFRKYNTQSQTLYLTEKIGEKTRIGTQDIDIVYVNNLFSGKKDNKVQIKIYQKSYDLVRIELSILETSIIKLHTETDYINFIKKIFEINLNLKEYVKRIDLSLDKMVLNISLALGISSEVCYILKDIDIFETNRATDNLRRKLIKKGILVSVLDDDGKQKVGFCKVALWFRGLFSGLKSDKGKELFLPGKITKII